MHSIWQARQLNQEVHVLYDHHGTVKESCRQRIVKNSKCESNLSVELYALAKLLKPVNVYLIDLNLTQASVGIENFTRAFQLGNNKTIFELYHPDKWAYEEWCALRWLYAYKYALLRRFDVIYIQDSDVLLYGNVTVEYDSLQPTDAAVSGGTVEPGRSGHNAFLHVKTLRNLLDFMLDTWHGRTDVSGYVKGYIVTDMFYFSHFFENRKTSSLSRARGVIVRTLSDPYYGTHRDRLSARIFDHFIADSVHGRYPLRNFAFPDNSSANFKSIIWTTKAGENFQWPHMSSSITPRYAFIYHNELQKM
ncbi:unnamed protein product, partial [Rotaria magnacalcarata]